VIGVGENSVDDVLLLSTLPQRGGSLSKVQIRDRRLRCGGQVATALATCASLGLRTMYVGVAGGDAKGRRLREELARRGVDVTHLVERDSENRYAVILVDQNSGERLILSHRTDRLNLRDGELPVEDVGQARLVHVDQTDETAALRAAEAGRRAGSFVTTDIDAVGPRTGELMRLATHAILAEDVARQLTGSVDLEAALGQLRQTLSATLVVTQGAAGASALAEGRFIRADGFRVAVRDTTGAGDVFRGGLIHGILSGEPIDRALCFANAAAAVSCTRVGALDGVPTRREIETLLSSAP
jgi:sulfofructose kinase